MNIWDLLPQDPWNGPPLPRCMNIFWSWISGQSNPILTTPSLSSLLSGATSSSPPATPAAPAYENRGNTLYENEERIQLVRGQDGHITEMVIHRKVKQDV